MRRTSEADSHHDDEALEGLCFDVHILLERANQNHLGISSDMHMFIIHLANIVALAGSAVSIGGGNAHVYLGI